MSKYATGLFLIMLFSQRAWSWDQFLDPSKYPGLPADIAAKLKTEGCTIPQSKALPSPNNAVRGELVKKGQTDWAILCYVDSVRNEQGSNIPFQQASTLIFYGAKNHCGENGQRIGKVLRKQPSKRDNYIRLASPNEFKPYRTETSHMGVALQFSKTKTILYYCDDNGWGESPDRE